MGFLVSCSLAYYNTGTGQDISIAADNNHVKNFSLKEGHLIDSFRRDNITTKIYLVAKDKRPVTVNLQTGDTTTVALIRSRPSVEYWYNFFFMYGFIFKHSERQRFSYPSESFYEIKNSQFVRRNVIPVRTGHIDFRIMYPVSNNIGLVYNNFYISKTGALMGIGIGADFYTNPKQYFSIDLGTATDWPFMAEKFGISTDTTNYVTYASARYNYVLDKFHLGYGINISRYRAYMIRYSSFLYSNTLYSYTDYRNTSAGLSFSAQYRITPRFSLGFLWQPNIYTFTKAYSGFAYQNYFSFNMNFIITVKR
jgi:hypothetical protein